MKLPPRTSSRGSHADRRGIALVTVLSVLLLLTVLIVGILSLSQRELANAGRYADAADARWLKDFPVNLVIAQIRDATTRPETLWASQPGAIRTYDNEDAQTIFKLYSSPELVTDTLSSVEAQDLSPNWRRHPDRFVDLNRPTTGRDGDLHYPVADPRLLDGPASPEGFSLPDPVPGGRRNRDLPMPVSWLYVLADGSVGSLSAGGRFVGSGGRATESNPIVGRIAFWADDETCKVNVNTASEGVHWDLPRADSDEDRRLARNQPVKNEFQRYPGHPATTCLSSVFFPGERPAEDGADALTKLEAIYQLSPGLRWNLTSKAGTTSVPPGEAGGSDNTIPDDFHLYANIDEVLFAADVDARGQRLPSALKTLADTVSTDRLKRSRFFLTANSRSPETTVHGFPRVALWPIASTNTRDAGATNFRKRGNLSAVDKLVRFCSSIDDEEYAFQRRQTELMRVDFSNTDRGSGVDGNAKYGRNVAVYNMLSTQTELPVPGFGGVSIDDKYGMSGRARFGYGPSQHHRNGIVSDRDQNLFAMFDFIRATNMADRDGTFYGSSRHSVVDNLRGNRLQPGLGQTAGLIHEGFFRFPGAGQWHNFRKEPTPKGIGRLPGISEAALVVICNGQVKSDGSIDGGGPFKNGTATQAQLKDYWRNLKKVGHETPPAGPDLDPEPGERRIQVALVLEAFTPGHGWGHLIPGVSATIAGNNPAQGIREGNPPMLKFKVGNDELLIPYAGQDTGNDASFAKSATFQRNLKLTRNRSYEERGQVPVEREPQLTPEWAAWGANMGPRAFGATAFVWDEFVLPPGAGIEFLGTAADPDARPRQQTDSIKVAIFDRSWYGNFWTVQQTSGNAGNQNQFARYDINQTYEFRFPPFTAPAPSFSNGDNSYRNYWTNHFRGSDGKGGVVRGEKLSRLAYARQGGPGRLFVPEKDIVRSLVPRHNDYRVLASRTYVNSQHFIPHPDYGSGARMAHSFTEPLDTNAYDGNASDAMHPLVPGVEYPPAATPDAPAPFLDAGYVYPRPDRTNNNPQRPLTGYDLASFTPDRTGDFDTGLGPAPDGAYINRPDDLDLRGMGSNATPYFDDLRGFPVSNAGYLAPNKLIPSAAMFGSLPSRTRLNIPWLTLLFRPHQEDHPGGDPDLGVPDHLWLDYWWMPVVEPYAISEPFATAGKINLNHQLLPFTYIERSTGLHAVFKSEKVMAIPDTAGPVYKTGAGNVEWRHHINTAETLKQFDDRFNTDGTLFKTASEICSLWLVPESDENDAEVKLGTRDDATGRYSKIEEFWQTHRLTGDNVRERPYASIYPRVCTRSNTFNVHFIVQAVQKARSTDPARFDPQADRVTAEFRGSTLIERKIDADDPAVPDFAGLRRNRGGSVDQHYSFRIVNERQFSP